MLESQSKALKVQILALFPKKHEPKKWLLGWPPGPGKIGQNAKTTPLMTSPTENPKLKSFLTGVPESVEGLNSSLALAAGELWLQCTGHHS